MGFKLDTGVAIHLDCRFDSTQHLVIGNGTVINRGTRLDTRGYITIGCHVSISEEVIILTADHDINTSEFKGRIKPVTIGDRVFIGTRAMILPGCTIGDGAVIAAGAVLTKSAPPFSVWAGVPARQISRRYETLTYTIDYNRILH